jgi:hypothetical protein
MSAAPSSSSRRRPPRGPEGRCEDAFMSRTRSLTATVMLAALGGALLTPSAAAAPDVLEETRTFDVPSPRATGYDIDLDGDLAVFTGRYRSTSAAGTGLVQVARWADGAQGGWVVSDLPVPADARGYGASVAVDEESGRVAVGALTTQQVVVYAQDGADDWQVERVLTPPADPRVGRVGSFGESIALDGGTLVVGAPNSTVDGRAGAGVAYAFDLGDDAGTGRPLLPDTDEVIAYAIAGQSVAVADGTIAVGAPQIERALDFYGGSYRVGGVYLWDADDLEAGPSLTSQPVGEAARSVPPPGTGGGPAFGYSLAIVGDRLYVGSPLEVNYTADDPDDPVGGYNDSSVDEGTTTQGAVYVYDVTDSAAPAQVGGKLMPPAHTWEFAGALDATEDALLASGSSAADQHLGQVYVLDPSAVDPAVRDDAGLHRQVVEPAQVLRGSDMQPGARFGGSALGAAVATSGRRAAVAGFPAGTAASGRVYLFDAVSAAAPELTVADAAITYGQEAVVTATVTGGVPASASVSVGGVEVPGAAVAGGTITVTLPAATLAAGVHTVTVDALAADGGLLAAGTGMLTVHRAATTLTLGAADPTGTAESGRPVAISGTVATGHGTVPTGAVELVADGEVVATATAGAAGGFTAEVPGAAVGASPLALVARYGGDANHEASDGAVTIDVPQPRAPEPSATVGPAEPGDPVTPAPGPGTRADTDRPALRSGGLAVTGAGGLFVAGGLAAALAGAGVALVQRARRRRGEA